MKGKEIHDHETRLSILKQDELNVYLPILGFRYVARVYQMIIIHVITFLLKIIIYIIKLHSLIITLSTDVIFILIHCLICPCDSIAEYIYIYIHTKAFDAD